MRMTLSAWKIGAILLFISLIGSGADGQDIILSTTHSQSDTCKVIFADSAGLTVRRNGGPYYPAKVDSYRERFTPNEINRIVIPRESHFGSGLGYGFLAGAGTGAIIGLASGDEKSGFFRFTAAAKAFLIGVPLGVVGAIVGGIIGASQGLDDDLVINGDVGRYLIALPKLREVALYKSVKIPDDTGAYDARRVEPIPLNVTRLQEPSAKKFHLSVGGGLRLAGPEAGNMKDAFNSSSFGGTVDGWFGPVTYPTDNGTPVFWDLSAEYNISENLRLGLSWSSNPINEISGRDRETENTHAQSYAIICTYVPSPVDISLATRSEISITAGFSYNVMNVRGSISTFSYTGVNQFPTVISQSNNTLGFVLRVSYDYYLSKTFSLQLGLGGNMIPGSVNMPETFYSNPYDNSTKILEYHSINFSGLDLTTAIRIHL